jgi:hypothetical protein
MIARVNSHIGQLEAVMTQQEAVEDIRRRMPGLSRKEVLDRLHSTGWVETPHQWFRPADLRDRWEMLKREQYGVS